MVVTEPVFTVCGTPTYVAPEILAETGEMLRCKNLGLVTCSCCLEGLELLEYNLWWKPDKHFCKPCFLWLLIVAYTVEFNYKCQHVLPKTKHLSTFLKLFSNLITLLQYSHNILLL